MRVPLRDFAQKLLEHVVVRLRPVRAAPDFPEVDDVADEVDRFGFRVLQEIQKGFRLGGSGAKMHVGEKNGPIMLRAVTVLGHVSHASVLLPEWNGSLVSSV